MKTTRVIYISIETLEMIFRDKNTGALLNIRRDEYTTDRMYFQEIIRVGHNHDHASKTCPNARPYSIPFQDLQSQHNYT